MITIFVKGGTLYRFPSMKVAKEWLAENPEEYDFDRENIEMFTNVPPRDTISLADTLYIRVCDDCKSFIKFEKADNENIANVICPVCGNHLGPQI